MEKKRLWGRVEELLRGAGAVACGAAEAGPVDDAETARYERWLASGHHAGMDYMTRHAALRRDPRLLLEGARTVISMAFSFAPAARRTAPGMVACYAFGDDYHDVLRGRLNAVCATLREEFGGDYRVCIDSAPIHERYWAERAGTGRRLENGMIAVAGHGCEVFLAEILTTLEIPPLPEPHTSHTPHVSTGCLHCGACRRACPAGALDADGTVDSRRCLSYLTIEHRGDWTDSEALRAMATPAGRAALFGCDLCLRACPLNAGVPPTDIREFAARREILGLTATDAAAMTQPEFSRVFKGSPIKRTKLAGLQRNARNALGKGE